MLLVLRTLAALGLVLFALGIALGLTLDSVESVGRHFLIGLGVAVFTVFVHSLILFYLIGTGVDIREAVADAPEIRAKYVEFTREQKRRAFPVACLSIVLMVLAALMGGEVHSRLIAAAEGDALPLRGVPFWWIHLACVLVAVATSVYGFWIEAGVVRDNRRAIEEINAFLALDEGSGASARAPPEGGPERTALAADDA